MGIRVWEERGTGRVASVAGVQKSVSGKCPEDTTAAQEKDLPEQDEAWGPAGVGTMEWEALEQAVRRCTQCPLYATRTQTVFGVGDRSTDWLFVGEAPGVEEDRKGEPFVGRAGQLLNAMLFAIGLKRQQVYIANVLKCRPPANRDPMGEEVIKCEPYLHRQVKLIQPRVIVALGRFAAQSLLKTNTPIGKLRGQRFTYADTGIPMVVTYHPAYLLRNPIDKRKVWDDLCLARSVLEAP